MDNTWFVNTKKMSTRLRPSPCSPWSDHIRIVVRCEITHSGAACCSSVIFGLTTLLVHFASGVRVRFLPEAPVNARRPSLVAPGAATPQRGCGDRGRCLTNSIADRNDSGMLAVVGLDTATPQLIADLARGAL
jgi:hypothetical protein